MEVTEADDLDTDHEISVYQYARIYLMMGE